MSKLYAISLVAGLLSTSCTKIYPAYSENNSPPCNNSVIITTVNGIPSEILYAASYNFVDAGLQITAISDNNNFTLTIPLQTDKSDTLYSQGGTLDYVCFGQTLQCDSVYSAITFDANGIISGTFNGPLSHVDYGSNQLTGTITSVPSGP